MEKKNFAILPLFECFISDSYKGKRLKSGGRKIKPQTIDNYKYVLKHLQDFQIKMECTLEVKIISGKNKKEVQASDSYWKKFYKRFTDCLYKKGCFDNYVGNIMKTLRLFFNYLKKDKHMQIGDFYNQFYICKEEIPVITLMPDQLQFLINDIDFERRLSKGLQTTKDIFVFGCTVALRWCDLFSVRFTDVEKFDNKSYLCTRSIKTEIPVRMNLPSYLLEIIDRFSKIAKKRKTIFPNISLNQFNKNIKALIEKAGWTFFIGKTRSQRGKWISIKPKNNNEYRFCDLVSSHTMRRTAITTMLMLGMREHVVKKISGHAENSKAFYRYVNLAQSYMDSELDKVFDSFQSHRPVIAEVQIDQ